MKFILNNFLRALRCNFIDVLNFFKYGEKSVQKYSIAWINPLEIKHSTRFFPKRKIPHLCKSNDEIPIEKIKNNLRKFISKGDWDRKIINLNQVRLIERTIRHYSNNETWDEVGEINWMEENIKFHGSQDGCSELKDVLSRLERLDKIKVKIEKSKSLKSQKDLNSNNFRGTGGIGIGISREGNIFWMGGGGHRLAIAQVLKLKKIPVFIKIIHEDAIINKSIYEKISWN